MSLPTPKALHDAWRQQGESMFLSPPIDKHWEQVILFPSEGNDYSISIDFTPLKGQPLNNVVYNEAGVVFRYNGENQYYYAGIGGFGARIFIGMVEIRDGKGVWSRLASQGKREQLAFETTYRLRVECLGTQLTLYENDAARLSVQDDTYRNGHWGLRTLRTQVQFGNIVVGGPATPQCFVIIPFATSFAFVYDTIERTVRREGLDCTRADQSAISEPIINDIRRHILAADLIIADLTGRNPNVYYEAGFAHALDKRLILIARSVADLAFDLSHIRTIIYAGPEDLGKKLARAIQDTYWRSRIT